MDDMDLPQGLLVDEDCLQTILSLLPFEDKVKCERVCRSWNVVAARLVRTQRVLGNAPTRLDLVDRCNNSRHYVTSLDLVPKQVLTNLSLLPKILQKCPELRAIAITRSREPTFTEVASSKRRADNTEREDERHEATANEEPMNDMESLPPVDLLLNVSRERRYYQQRGPLGYEEMRDARRRMIYMSRQRNAAAKCSAPRPANEEDFLDIVAKYAPKLECIDVSGLRLLRGYRAGSDEAGAWKLVIANCGQTLQHIRTFYMKDKELHHLLMSCVRLSDVSIINGVRGDHLSAVRPSFHRMSIGSVRESGLQQLVQAGNLTNFRDLSLCSVNRNMILVLVENLRMITTLNLSLATSNLTPTDVSRIAYLSNLSHLYIKRKSGSDPFEDFDHPFCDIMRRCSRLKSIRLTNLTITDNSLKQITDVSGLTDLSLLYTSTKGEKTLSDRSLCRIALLSSLKRCSINYPNTFTENTLIDFLFKAYRVRELILHGCRELIPIKQILQAAIRQAISIQRQQRPLTIDIDTRENIDLENYMSRECGRTNNKSIPRNLFYTISTGKDFYSTHLLDERPAKDPFADEDFDERESFPYELQHV